jgi:predicted ATP-grasp superfamily ATP-dependent carboligase
MDALVTDVQHRAAVAGVRALGREGLAVLTVAPRPNAAGLWSRYARKRAIAPPPASDPAGFADSVARLAEAHGPLVIYPGCEDAIEAILATWDELPAAAIRPYPGPKPLTRVRDKRLIAELARAAGLRVPRTFASDTARNLARMSLPLPCIVKPPIPSGRLRGAHWIDSSAELSRLLEAGRLPEEEPLLVQEWVPGRVLSVELVLRREGGVAASFHQLASHTSPARAGLISVATSVGADPDLTERIARALAGAGFWGLAQVDLIDSDGGLVLVDVNPRFYACLPLALACGVNLPAAWHAVTLGEPVAPTPVYPTGVTYRWLEGELVEALRGERGRLRRRAGRPVVGAMWARDDPVAAAALTAGALGTRISQRLPRAPRG